MGLAKGLTALSIWLATLFVGLWVLQQLFLSIVQLPPMSWEFSYAFLCLAFLTIGFIVIAVVLIVLVCLAFRNDESEEARWLLYLYSSKR